FKKHIQAANDTLFKEIKEYEQIFDDLDAEYERCVLDNKNLTIEKKNLLIKNDCLIAECLEKEPDHRILPSKSVNARRAADHNRKLNFVDHNQFVIRSLKSVNTKTPQAKHSVNHTKKVWKETRNHNVNTTKTTWRPTRKVVGSVKP
ncbi:hypothetical protein Tco_0063635, partial [Tanacetum coccineum]